jgi:hypothetical protein
MSVPADGRAIGTMDSSFVPTTDGASILTLDRLAAVRVRPFALAAPEFARCSSPTIVVAVPFLSFRYDVVYPLLPAKLYVIGGSRFDVACLSPVVGDGRNRSWISRVAIDPRESTTRAFSE